MRTLITRTIEVVTFYCVLFAINYFFFPAWLGWMGVDPHPYWLPILVFAYRYGLGYGLTTGILSGGAYLVIAWFTQDKYLFEDTTFYILPTLFVIGGIYVGYVASKLNKRWQQVKVHEHELDDQFKAIKDELKVVKEINRGLEKRVVTRMTTLVTLYEGARKLESVHVEEIFDSLCEFISKTLEAEEVSLYLKKNDNWVLKTSFGLKDYHKIPTVIGLEEGMIGLAGHTEKVVSIRDQVINGAVQTSTLGDCLFAGVVRKGKDGPVLGTVAIHKIPFLQFNSATLTLFSFILDWVSRSLGRALLFDEMREQEILDPEFHVYSQTYFKNRLAQEFSRSKTYNLPLSVVFCSIVGLTGLTEQEKRAYFLVLSHFFRKNCREIDVVCCSSEIDMPFAIIMVTTTALECDQELSRLKGLYSKLELTSLSNGNIPALQFKKASFNSNDQFVVDMVSRASE